MKTYSKLFLLISIFFLLAQTVQAQLQEKKWKISEKQGSISYYPKTLKKGETFFYIAFLPKKISRENKKEWLLKMLKKQEKSTGKPIDGWKIKQDKKGEWNSTGYVYNKEKKLLITLETVKFNNEQSFIFELVGSPSQLLKLGTEYYKIIDDAKMRFNKKQLIASNKPQKVTRKKLTTKQERKEIEKAIRTQPKKGVNTSEIETIWVNSWLNVVLGGISVDTYLLLKNGTAYIGLKIPPDELLVNKSKELQPKKWTKWRKSGKGYQIFNKKKIIWEELEGNRAINTRLGEKISQKYITASGSQMFGSHQSWITFKPNGSFELKNLSIMGSPEGSVGPSVTTVQKSDKTGSSGTTVVSGKNIGGGTTSKKKDGNKNTGTYYLDGYTIILKHDNGYEHTELFFFDKPNKKSFIYKDERFWIDENQY